MIHFEMQLDDVVMDTVCPCSFELRRKGYEYLCRLKAELMKKHQVLLSKSKNTPQFFLTGVPSRINSFVSLMAK